VLLGSVVFLAEMTLFGAVRSPLALLTLPAAVLTGMAFATPVFAFAASRDSEEGFAALFRFVVTPLFLFGGVFFPIEQLPPLLEQLAYATPLWHGVALSRGLALGTATAGGVVLHVAYLSAWIAVGGWLAARAFLRRLAI
jgi:lipooligosaccharide transport system permease protein